MIKRIAVSIGTAALAFVAAISARAQTYSNAVQALNPVAYWPLAESTAPASGSLYVATNSGTLGAAGNGYYETFWQTNGSPGALTNGNSIVHIAGAITGDSDTAMQQGAVGQYVVIPRTTNGVFNPSVTITAPFSIEAWVFPTNGTANQLKPILAEGFGTALATNINNDVTTIPTYGGTSFGMFSSFIYFNTFNFGAKNEIDTATLPLNKWYHIVGTFDGTTMRFYTNGVLVGTRAPALNNFGQRYTPDLVSPLVIGGGNELGISGGANVEFGGGIDEVAIYNSVLSQAQVTSHYTTGTNASRTTPYAQVVQGDSPAIYLRLDEPSFTGPTLAASPVANNYGSLGSSANGFYLPGTTPGIAGPPYTGFGPSSLGVALNGFNAGVDVGGGALPAQLNPTGNQPLSVTAWFKGNPSDAVARFQEIVGHSDAGWRLSLDNNEGSRFNPGNGPELQFSSLEDVLLNGAFVDDAKWHFIAGVSDGTNDSLYIDGLLVKTGSSVGTVTGNAQDVILGGDPQYLAPQPLSIGGGGRWFDGSLAQVAFFTNALSGSQIASIYNAAGVPPAIRVQPVSQNLFPNDNASIPAVAIGSGISYQWYTTANTPVSGQTTSALTFTPATAADAGSYYLVVSSTLGSVTSSVVQVVVASPTQETPYANAIHQLNPVAYWPLNETVQPPPGQYIATNSGTAGAAGNAYYGSWYQPVTIGTTNTYFATNSIIHSAGATGDGDADMLCVNAAAGAGQYVVLPRFTNGVANPAASITGAFSIEAWLKTTNMASNLKPAVTQGRNQNQSGASQQFTNNEYGFSLGQFTNFFYFQVYDGQHQGNGGQPQIQISNLQSNVWYHVVVTYDGSTETIYSNGVAIQSATAPYAPDPVSPLIIGSGTDVPTQTGGQEFSGEIDDVAIYNTALNATQVANHFAAVGPGYAAAILADSPTLYYRLDEPAFNSYPSPSTYPVAVNYGSAGAAANGAYMPGTAPGAAGPSFTGFGSSKAVAINGYYGGVDIGGGLTPTQLNPLGSQPETVVAWFQGNPVDARFQEIVSRGDSGWRVALNGNNGNPSTAPYDLHFNPGNNPGDLSFVNFNDVVTNNFEINDGNWHMVAGVSDGTNATLYIDGAFAKSTNKVTNLTGTTLDAMIGGSPAHTTPSFNTASLRYFDGQIAQVAYFSNALSATQVQQLFNVAGVPLTLISQPQSGTFNVGTSASMSVVVRGSSPIYQWYSTNVNNGTVAPVAGQTNASLVFNPSTLAENGFYFVIATNAFNAVTSSVAQLTIVGPPVIVNSSPNTLHVFAGTTPTLNVSIIGPTPSFQWYSNNIPISNATNSTFVTNSSYAMTNNDTSSVGTFTYKCVITNSIGSATDTFVMTVLADPTAPYPAQVLHDKPIFYYRLDEPDTGYPNDGVIAYDYAGGENGSYSNVNLSEPGYSSATDPSETSAGFGQQAGKDSYMGSVPSYVDLSVPTNNSAEFTVECWANANIGQLFDAGLVTIGYGFGGEEFALENGGNDPNHAVRFYVNGANGANYGVASSFVLANNPGWHYIVAVCDEAGGKVSLYIDGVLQGSIAIPATAGIRTETSPLAIGSRLSTSAATDYDNQFFGFIDDVAIYNYAFTPTQVGSHYFASGIAPVITQVAPIASTNNPGSSASFTVTASGTQPLSYEWFDPNNNPINGQTNPTLVLNNIQPSQAGTYSVAVANIYGTATTNVNLIVNSGPATIVTDLSPTNLITFAGTTETYSILAGGNTPLFYQWFLNGSAIPGATNSSYTFSVLLGTNNYFVTVTNSDSGGSPAVSSTGTVVGMPSTTLNPANYTDKMKITFPGYHLGQTLQDFPVLVQLSTNIPGFNYTHFASASGGDLRFTDSGGTRVIPAEIDEWNPNGQSIVWVQMPTLSSSNDFIWAYWGNPANTTALPGSNVWVPQPFEGLPPYMLVYHLKESGFPYADSASQNPALLGSAPTQTNGLIGLGQLFGSGSSLNAGVINLTNGFNLVNGFTVSAWVNLNPGDANIQTVWANKVGGFSSDGFGLYINSFNSNPGDGAVHLETGNGAAGAEVSSPAGSLPAGGWHLLTADINPVGGIARLFVDTNDVTSGSDGIHSDMATTNDVNLGQFLDGSFPFNGLIDEARIQFGTNSPAWITAEYLTVAQNATLQSYSAVNSSVASSITILFQKSGGNLILDGSGGPAGQPYTVLSSTNVALPVAQWTSVTTSNFDASGNFTNVVPLTSTNKALFFRIAIP